MAFQTAILESIPQTKYLSADNYTQYRAIMRVFYLEHQKMRYQLDKETILLRLHDDPIFSQYSEEQLKLDLDQLVSWKNLTPIQDPHKVYTVADFKNRQFQYMMSQAALEIERMTVTLENLYTRTVSLSSSTFRRIHDALSTVDQLSNMSHKEVGSWWQDLQEDFNRLSESHQDYLREFYGPSAEKQMKSSAFIAHKQHLVHYLEEFIQDLQSSSIQIGAQLEALSREEVERILNLVHQSELELPRPQSEMTSSWEDDLRTQELGVWQSLVHWFVGQDSTANQAMEVTNEVIRRVVQNAALLVQMQNMGVSKKAELRHLLSLFSKCETLEDAHKLSSQVFGAQKVRHFTVNNIRSTERIDSSTYDEPPMDYLLEPRVRTYKPRMDRSGFSDKTAEKNAQRQAILEEQRRLRQQVLSYIQNGVLDFKTISRPVTPNVRNVFLSWVAMANLSPDKSGRTEYGQAFSLQKNGTGTCRLVCTDGELTMPNYILVFEEDTHE